MANSKLDRAVAEARRFLAVATDYQNAIQNEQNAVDRAIKADPSRSHYKRDFPVKSGATRRASMDLTRALADLRRPA